MLVPKLRFKEFDYNWKEIKIDKIVDVFDGTHQTPNYTKSGVKFLSVENIKNLPSSNKYISIEDFEKDFRVYPQKDDILMTRIGDIGTPNIIKNNEKYGFYVSLALLKNKKKINMNYLLYLIQTNNFQKELWKRTLHIAFPKKINKNEISEIVIKYSENNLEQEKIANFLSLLDKKIELQKQKIEALKIYKRGIIQRIYNSSWNNKIKMEEILIQKSIRNTNDEIHNVYSVSNKDGFILQTEQFKDRIVASEDTRNYKVVAKNDFAYNPARINVGSIARMKQDIKGIISPMYICFKCNEKILPEYLEYFFESSKFTYEMSKRLEGSVRMCLSYESMLNIPIESPNKNEQEKISTFLNSLSNKIKLEEKKFMELNKLKKGLLQKMFI